MSANLQQLVDERNYAAEYILAGLKASESTDKKLPVSLQRLVSERNHTAENTLISLKPRKIEQPKLSLVQKIKETRNQVIDSKEQLVALEPSSSQENVETQYIASHSNVEIQPIASLIEPKKIDLEEAPYTVFLQHKLLPIDTVKQFSNSRQEINSTGSYLLALEPFLQEQKPKESPINST